MDKSCRLIIDTISDLSRPTATKIFYMPLGGPFNQLDNSNDDCLKLLCVPYNSSLEINDVGYAAPELLSFPTSDGSETLHENLSKIILRFQPKKNSGQVPPPHTHTHNDSF